MLGIETFCRVPGDEIARSCCQSSPCNAGRWKVEEGTLISGQAELSVNFEVSFTIIIELAFDIPDIPLAVPCIVGEEESIPGETKQKGGQVVVLSKRQSVPLEEL